MNSRFIIISMLIFWISNWGYSQQVFDAVDWNSNTTPYNNWVAATGEMPDHVIDFEQANLRNSPPGPAYKNLHNNSSLFPLNVTLLESDNNLWVAEGDGQTWWDVNNDNDEDLGVASSFNHTIDPANNNWSLSLYQENLFTIDFTANPVDYFGLYWVDWDLRGESENFIDNANVTVTFTDNTTYNVPTDRTASGNGNSNAGWEFFGFYRGNRPQIKMVVIEPSDHDSQWGVDNLMYGNAGATACEITVNSITPSACEPNTNTYSLDVVVTHSNSPGGNITVNTSNGGTISVPAGTSPQTITLTGLTANGAQDIDVTAYFISDPGCTHTFTDAYDAPVSCECPAVNCSSISVIKN